MPAWYPITKVARMLGKDPEVVEREMSFVWFNRMLAAEWAEVRAEQDARTSQA
jgi:hypothetical protein